MTQQPKPKEEFITACVLSTGPRTDRVTKTGQPFQTYSATLQTNDGDQVVYDCPSYRDADFEKGKGQWLSILLKSNPVYDRTTNSYVAGAFHPASIYGASIQTLQDEPRIGSIPVPTGVSAPPKPPEPKPDDTQRDVVADLYPANTPDTTENFRAFETRYLNFTHTVAVEGAVRGHVENLAIECYLQIEGVHHTDVDQVDVAKLVKLRDRLHLEMTSVPIRSNEYWHFHYCAEHSVSLELSVKNNRWYHAHENGYHYENGEFVADPDKVQPQGGQLP